MAILAKYLDNTNVFSKKLIAKLFKYFNINKFTINLKPAKQPSYESIYSSGLVKLKILKTYIETNLANDFICFFNFSTRALILFIQKIDSNFYLYINY